MDPNRWMAFAARGIAGLVFGAIVLSLPTTSLVNLALLFVAYSLIDGIITIAFVAGEESHGWLFVLEGLLGVAAGVAVVAASSSTRPLAWPLVAFWALGTGVIEIAAASRMGREPMLIVAGFVSLALGLGILARPSGGVLVLSFLLGSYALLFGSAMLAVALRTRRGGRAAV